MEKKEDILIIIFINFVFTVFIIGSAIIIFDNTDETHIVHNTYLNNTVNNITYLEQEFNNITKVTRISNNTHYVKDKINYQIRKIRWCSKRAELVKSKGQSMFPYSWEDGWHWQDKVKFKDIEIGDIITYEKNGKKIHHAVCNLYDDYLITCGYSNNYYDKNVYPDEVLYRDCMPNNNK